MPHSTATLTGSATTEAPSSAPDTRSAPRRRTQRFITPTTVALTTWIFGTVCGLVLPMAVDPNPFTLRGALLPVAIGGLLVFAVLAVTTTRVPTDNLAGAAAGLFAGWVTLVLRSALNGTPYGFGGLLGDMGRMTASADQYSVTLGSADGIVSTMPSEYPPLYPWLIGRTAALLDIPAWRLLAEAEILTTAATVVIAFLLWSRLAAPWPAFGIAVAGLAAFGDPQKAFVVLTATIFLPWALMTFCRPPRGALSWWAAGLISGLCVLTYQGILVLGSLGLLAVLALAWHQAEDRVRYARHVILVGAVTIVISLVYTLPYVGALIGGGGQQVADLFESGSLAGNPFPFLAVTPLGALQLIGLLGTVWYRRSQWWATPILCLILGTYAYRVLMLLRFVVDGHTGMLHYTSRLIGPLLVAAGVLTLTHAAPRLLDRLSISANGAATAIGSAFLCLLCVWGGLGYWAAAFPKEVSSAAGFPAGTFNAARAHSEPLPNGLLPRYAPAGNPVPVLPIESIRNDVARVLGAGERPATLAFDERLFAFLPWRGYLAVDATAANTVSRWDDRYAELVRVAGLTDPGTFARESARTEFGPIDVFVLRKEGAVWTWRPNHRGTLVTFRPRQFDPAVFEIRDDLPGGTVLVIRRR